MAKWQYKKSGRVLGPIEEEQLVSLGRLGQLEPDDLVRLVGQDEWVPLRTLSLSKLPSESGLSPEELERLDPERIAESVLSEESFEKKWVLLRKKMSPSGETHWLPDGPWSTDEISRKIYSGDVDFSSYIWTKALSHWTKIRDVEEFNPNRANSAGKTSPAAEAPQQSTWSRLYRRVTGVRGEEIGRVVDAPIQSPGRPAEAEGPDLASGTLAQPKKSTASEDEKGGRFSFWVKEVRPTPRGQQIREKKGRWRLLLWGVLIAGAAFYGADQYLESPFQKKVVKTSPPAQSQKSEKVRSSPSNSARSNRAKKKSWVRRPWVKLRVSGLSQRPQLQVRTNAAVGQSIHVVLLGRGFQFLGPMSYRRSRSLYHRQGAGAFLSLSSLDAPTGHLRAVVRVGETVQSLDFFHGKKDRQFQRQLHRKFKRHALSYQLERKRIFEFVLRQQNWVAQLQRELKPSTTPGQARAIFSRWLKGFEKSVVKGLSEFSLNRWERYVLPEMWFDLQELALAWVRAGSRWSKAQVPINAKKLQQKAEHALRQLRKQRETLSTMSLYAKN